MLRIFDQSPRRNHLHIAQKGGHVPTVDHGVNASRAAFSLGGAAVYAAYFEGGMGYRNDNTAGVATDVEEETLYMVTSGQHFNAGCAACTTESALCVLLSFARPDDALLRTGCFDYGNAETNNHDDGTGTMEAVCALPFPSPAGLQPPSVQTVCLFQIGATTRSGAGGAARARG